MSVYEHEKPKAPEIVAPDRTLPPHPLMPFIFGPLNSPLPAPEEPEPEEHPALTDSERNPGINDAR